MEPRSARIFEGGFCDVHLLPGPPLEAFDGAAIMAVPRSMPPSKRDFWYVLGIVLFVSRVPGRPDCSAVQASA
jgi:hypothetical protein